MQTISTNILTIPTNPKAKENFFKGKEVALMGTFTLWSYNELAIYLKEMGATVVEGVSASTTIVCAGENTNAAQMAIGNHANVLTEPEIEQIINSYPIEKAE